MSIRSMLVPAVTALVLATTGCSAGGTGSAGSGDAGARGNAGAPAGGKPACPGGTPDSNYACISGPVEGTVVGAAACNVDGVGTDNLYDSNSGDGFFTLNGQKVGLYIQLSDTVEPRGQAYLNLLAAPQDSKTVPSVGESDVGAVHVHGAPGSGYWFDHVPLHNRGQLTNYTVTGVVQC